jgi:hypothetical protein
VLNNIGIAVAVDNMFYVGLDGYAIGALLKKQNKLCVQSGNQLIISIPLDITSGENLVFFELAKNHDVYVRIMFGPKCNRESHLIVSYYTYNNDDFIF